jgi:hypothetical protein
MIIEERQAQKALDTNVVGSKRGLDVNTTRRMRPMQSSSRI